MCTRAHTRARWRPSFRPPNPRVLVTAKFWGLVVAFNYARCDALLFSTCGKVLKKRLRRKIWLVALPLLPSSTHANPKGFQNMGMGHNFLVLKFAIKFG
jgi:hypothetical protein